MGRSDKGWTCESVAGEIERATEHETLLCALDHTVRDVIARPRVVWWKPWTWGRRGWNVTVTIERHGPPRERPEPKARDWWQYVQDESGAVDGLADTGEWPSHA